MENAVKFPRSVPKGYSRVDMEEMGRLEKMTDKELSEKLYTSVVEVSMYGSVYFYLMPGSCKAGAKIRVFTDGRFRPTLQVDTPQGKVSLAPIYPKYAITTKGE